MTESSWHDTPAPADPIRDDPSTAGTRVRCPGRAAEALETGRLRLVITGLLLALGFLVVAGRLVDVSLLRGEAQPGRPVAATADATPAGRADITDRNGVLLATSLPTASLYADPAMVLDAEEAADRLATVLPDIDRAAVTAALRADRRFVWLRRGLSPRQQDRINRLGIPGLQFQNEQRRFYPGGSLTAHIIGYTDIDGRGIAGIEQRFDEVLRNRREPLALSIDLRVQQLVREELQASIDDFRAVGGAGIVLDARTGELVAMVSLPDFNPYLRGEVPEEQRFNRTAQGAYELGSVFKIFNTAMALDSGATSLSDGYDATNPIRVGRFVINDFHPEARWLTVPEIFMHSSNIGSVHMALDVGTERQQEYLRRFGLLQPSPVELPEVAWPLAPSPWREVNTMTISFGHGLAVTPVQLAGGVGAMVNGGRLVPATLLRRQSDEPAAGVRVVSERTSDAMRRLLRLVVEHGTGGNADVEGYLVGGKTGTAEKSRGSGYARDALISSFVAAFPMDRPQYVVFAMLDEPHGNARTYGYATGGWVAAPVVGRIVERLGPMVGIAPVDETDPTVQARVALDALPGASQLASFAER